MEKPRKPPAHLGRQAKAWYTRTTEDFDFESAAEWQLLEEAAGCLDRIRQAREAIDRDGLTTSTGSGGVKPHPAVQMERDYRTLFARLCRELRLTIPSDDDASRPPRLR